MSPKFFELLGGRPFNYSIGQKQVENRQGNNINFVRGRKEWSPFRSILIGESSRKHPAIHCKKYVNFLFFSISAKKPVGILIRIESIESIV